MDNTVKIDTGAEVYEHDIYIYLQQYVKEHEIEDLTKLTQNRWSAALMYVRKCVFNTQADLMSDINRSMYDEYKVNKICDIYINLCYEYDKEISINGFSFLTGINRDTIYSWGKEETRGYIYHDLDGNRIGNIQMWINKHPGEDYRQEVGSMCSGIYKKLIENNEESLSGKLISGGANPMKILPALNRRHGWNMGQPKGIDGSRQVRTPEQIAEEYGRKTIGGETVADSGGLEADF